MTPIRDHDAARHQFNSVVDRGLSPRMSISFMLRGHDSCEFSVASSPGSTWETRVRRRFWRGFIVFIIWIHFKSALFGAHVVGLSFNDIFSG